MKIALHTLLILTISAPIYAQDTFQNLNFEKAELVPIPWGSYFLDASRAVPGWRTGADWIWFNTIAMDAAAITLHDTHSVYVDVVQGNYSLLFQMASDLSYIPEIWQTGKVPELSLSLRFTTRAFQWNNHFNVTFNGNELPVQYISSSSGGTLWGADVSDFAGQTGDLKFQGIGVLDGIEFSPVAIPEPGICSLMLVSGGVVLVNRRCSRPRQKSKPKII